MESIKVNVHNNYEVRFVSDASAAMGDAINPNVVVVTDENVDKIYSSMLGKNKIVLAAGEASKSLEGLSQIISYLKSVNADRNTKLLAVGGGVIGDITGCAASLYMRGIKYIGVPTSLLAMVDSSVGGKTAINFEGVKNLVGSFYQPSEVIICPQLLDTLPKYEWRCGYGEIVKTAILDSTVHGLLHSHLRGECDILKVIYECVRFKADIVSRDERELGLRAVLNLGHTIGHAFEEMKLSGDVRHGEYVMMGLRLESKICLSCGAITYGEYMRRIELLDSFDIALPKICDIHKFIKHMQLDKKNKDGKINIVYGIEGGSAASIYLSAEQMEKELIAINE